MNKLIITPDTNVHELLETYPQLEDTLIGIAPVFKKLKNPVLRKTIARVTSLKQASVVGGVSLAEMINTLRNEIGQEQVTVKSESAQNKNDKPAWTENVKITYDAREDLENGVHPINKVMTETNSMNKGEVYLLVTPFVPAPLIDILVKKGFEVYTENVNGSEVRNYFLK